MRTFDTKHTILQSSKSNIIILSHLERMGSKSVEFRLARVLRDFVWDYLLQTTTMKSLLFLILASVLCFGFDLSIGISLLACFFIYLLTGGWRFAWVVIRTFPRDARALSYLIMIKLNMRWLMRTNGNLTTVFAKTVKRQPEKAAMLFENQTWTFRQVDEYSNAVANYFHDAGYRQGDVIAIFMETRPEFVCLWLGLAKIGVTGALINFNLRMEALVHCVKAADAKALIFGTELTQAMKDANGSFGRHMSIYCTGPRDPSLNGWASNLDPLIEMSLKHPPNAPVIKLNDKLFFIYTSGTTGLPKAAVITHGRFYYMSQGVHKMFSMRSSDVIYDTLPLYHSAGGILGVGQMIISGCTLVVKKKFSASKFWDDCVAYNCTVIQYIGEICRYLLAQPFRPTETQHQVRLAYGNGLRPQIWEQFVSRFGVKKIGEFYGATEGNANVLNMEGKMGAVGFTTRIAPALYPVTLIKVDKETGEPVRGRNGLCVHCQPGEPGELVGKIIKGDIIREFDGYSNQSATEKKVARDVFSKGDMAFLTGDVLVMDQFGYLYFRDRTGDTFRWKGENVSTAEVEAVISNIIKLKDAAVYGVEIPGMEGRAGMAAIVDKHHTVNLKALQRDLQKSLPPYARPIFIRLMEEVDTTGTFKLKKTELKKVGFNPALTGDKMFYLDSKIGEFTPLSKQSYNDICGGKIRF
ncbi:long-chain fatty acid transport protein 4 [Lingula anatina]|uniref:long-chain-fatty-acid--CoA ligase n=1 Tax=Lingula anatina TaxID=7574 RepID=A0A1S3IQ22_LINAN|nr:long-chain fatty acid transport protein 4 [Lingula anatina]|eukprot:XP_013399634.1 long-chain fatty acid transport protein 4 [Lingula anatina]